MLEFMQSNYIQFQMTFNAPAHGLHTHTRMHTLTHTYYYIDQDWRWMRSFVSFISKIKWNRKDVPIVWHSSLHPISFVSWMKYLFYYSPILLKNLWMHLLNFELPMANRMLATIPIKLYLQKFIINVKYQKRTNLWHAHRSFHLCGFRFFLSHLCFALLDYLIHTYTYNIYTFQQRLKREEEKNLDIMVANLIQQWNSGRLNYSWYVCFAN